MKDIKVILDNYSEQPSEEVWERLSARLDAEMPAREARRTAWKWVMQPEPSRCRLVGYDSLAPEPAMLMEKDSPNYGSHTTIKLRIPKKDISLAKELADRFGWEAI